MTYVAGQLTAYYNNRMLENHLQIQSQSMQFSKFYWEDAPDPQQQNDAGYVMHNMATYVHTYLLPLYVVSPAALSDKCKTASSTPVT